ncbi:MAG TPA: hypothetical protein ENH10_04365 [Bacteroidetes bacterium]|nr:hypothetical protein [Bacteroidota bacterium]HEX04373.1 hypothetical protein [Bacteroidota bacterium]
MKKPFINTLVILLLIGLTAAWWAFAVAMTELLGDAGRLVAEAVLVFAAFLMITELIMRTADLQRRSVHDERQLQAMFGLYATLKPDAPIPMLRSEAISADTALEYVRLIKQVRPNMVVELGCGVSTILAALQLRENGSGRVIALDDNEKLASKTRDDLLEHQVLSLAEVRYAELKPLKVEDETARWYNPNQFADIERIDMLLINGPRDLQDTGNRRPGLTYLSQRFSDDIVIIVDDGNRSRWRDWVHGWAKERGFVIEEPFLNEKRSMILYRVDSVLASQRQGMPAGSITEPIDFG